MLSVLMTHIHTLMHKYQSDTRKFLAMMDVYFLIVVMIT